MVDKQGRISVPQELLEKAGVSFEKEVYIFYDRENNSLILKNEIDSSQQKLFFIKVMKFYADQNRLAISISIRDTFCGRKFLPAERDGEIHILII